jgi:hypothetical protein
MMSEEKKPELHVTITFGDKRGDFSGDFDAVSRQVMAFLFEVCPALSLLRQIKLEVNLEELIKELQGILKIAKEGPYLLVPKDDFSASEVLGIYLIGAFIGYRLGILDKETYSPEELSSLSGIKIETVRVRLSEMAHERLVETTEASDRRITAIGIEHFRTNVLTKLKAR